MTFNLSPKFKRNFVRILPFGGIWLLTGIIFLIIEAAATGNQNLKPETDITLTLPIFFFASSAVAFFGLLVGAVEVILVEKLFRNLSLSRKIIYKFILYLFMILLVILITYPIAASIELGVSLLNQQVWQKLSLFLVSVTFFSTMVQLSFSVLLSLLYATISEHLGHTVLLNFFTGRYHKPIDETRIFMFLDMRSSTSIAEKLGHVQYFDLLKMYYQAMSDPIVNCLGEVYQYIGDEVVVSWKLDKGIENANCIQCFFAIKKSMLEKNDRFMKKFNVTPAFRAGIHIGEVTTGEIGALKKEIVFTGDVLNTTSRIQGLCKKFSADLIVSETLLSMISQKEQMVLRDLGEETLRGKSISSRLFAVDDFEKK